ncbi:MAG: urea carboxylase [Pseudomonadota bacterium]
MFNKVMIANRGVAAVRIARTLRQMQIKSVGLRSDAEAQADYFDVFDEVYDLGPGSVAETYLNQHKILDLALSAQVDAIHPGYGFLSENAEFARVVERAKIAFIGPSASTIEVFGLKHKARELALQAGLEMLPGTQLLDDIDAAVTAAKAIGYPVILKSTAGGGGIGMQRCDSEQQLIQAFESVQALAEANFSSAGLFLEKYLTAPRHVEVQIFGDGKGGILVIGDRDCSMQRRNQKVVEECPAPNMPLTTRKAIHNQAEALGRSVGYKSAGTVEFLYDTESGHAYFLEVNTRLQVEHAVTEMVWSIDLVEWMVRLSANQMPPLASIVLAQNGHAIQARWYAEDPYLSFSPAPGEIRVSHQSQARIETWIDEQAKVSHLFDPMLANIICHGANRLEAIEKLSAELRTIRSYGIATNLQYLQQAIQIDSFRAEELSTQLLAEVAYNPTEIEIIEPGMETTVQSYPGRQGLWEVGIPPSGPMDDLSFRFGNRKLGNPDSAPGLEILVSGPTVKFRQNTEVIITGAKVSIKLDELAQPSGQPIKVEAGQILQIGHISTGMRCYLLIRGGLDIKEELGSAATFTLGKFGGHGGRALRKGDVLRWSSSSVSSRPYNGQQPNLMHRTSIRLLLGPHGAPDFFTLEDMQMIFSASWKVHHNSSRTGIRLVGPQPQWARVSGGEAGLHPSNIHDNPYAFSALDFTGDMPVILGPDGPSLGGFVCPGVVINADRWKLGQLQPGDSVEFTVVSEEAAKDAWDKQEMFLAGKVETPTRARPNPTETSVSPVVRQFNSNPEVVVRQAGQEWVLVEIGPPEISIANRLIVHRLAALLKQKKIPGFIELTPGVRSLQIRFDPVVWTTSEFVVAITNYIQDALPDPRQPIESRIVKMPMSWDDPACRSATERYTNSVREDAPWCPDNIEFIRRINGLPSTQAVKNIVFNANYLVMGLGDVYLGAPVATPLDPRHRLVTTKYNPARTWTAENSVGIGGSYMCIYGMEGPGGYQFVGRTTQIWHQNGFASTGKPWLLDHFDQIQFYEVDAHELDELRIATTRGAYTPAIETTTFDLSAYQDQLVANSKSIEEFTMQREQAFDAEMDRWKADGLDRFVANEQVNNLPKTSQLADGHIVESPIAASVWRITQPKGQPVAAQSEIILLEAMKAEFSIKSPVSGNIEFLVKEGHVVEPGQPLAVIR